MCLTLVFGHNKRQPTMWIAPKARKMLKNTSICSILTTLGPKPKYQTRFPPLSWPRQSVTRFMTRTIWVAGLTLRSLVQGYIFQTIRQSYEIFPQISSSFVLPWDKKHASCLEIVEIVLWLKLWLMKRYSWVNPEPSITGSIATVVRCNIIEVLAYRLTIIVTEFHSSCKCNVGLSKQVNQHTPFALALLIQTIVSQLWIIDNATRFPEMRSRTPNLIHQYNSKFVREMG